MKDIHGNKLKVGDEVAFTYANILSTGKITKFYKSSYNRDECSIKCDKGCITHIESCRILKLKGKEE